MMLATVLLCAAALGGMAVLGLRMKGGNPPIQLAFVHGLVAAGGLVALGIQVLGQGLTGAPLVALVILVLAAFGGVYLVSIHRRGQLIPLNVAVVHGLLALSGVIVLLL